MTEGIDTYVKWVMTLTIVDWLAVRLTTESRVEQYLLVNHMPMGIVFGLARWNLNYIIHVNSYMHVCTCKVCWESLVKSWCDRFESFFQSWSNGPCGKVLWVPLIHSKDAVLQMCFFQSSPVEGCPRTYSFWHTSIPIAQYQLNKWLYLSGYYHVDAWYMGWVGGEGEIV